jgi:outer membrane protein assembly factor BamB
LQTESGDSENFEREGVMPRIRRVLSLLGLLGLGWATGFTVMATELSQEYVTTTPVLVDGILYVASKIYPGHRGHLRAIDVLDTIAVTVWDAAERVPLAGVGGMPGDLVNSDPPADIHFDNLYRCLFTDRDGAMLPLATTATDQLQPALGVASQSEAEILVHAVRGRRGGTAEQAAGTTEDSQRLWSISRSSPVLVEHSPVNSTAGHRDRVLYAGAEDGMLHAFFVSRWNDAAGNYPIYDPDGGAELWAYLPGSFLPHLKEQPLNDELGSLAVHLDGTPIAVEAFLDLDGDNQRSWSTLLVATGTILSSQRSCLFVLDITDPYHPGLLWQKMLPGQSVGMTRGVTVDRCGDGSLSGQCIYLTAGFIDEEVTAGIHALALELSSGKLLWQFSAPYTAAGPVVESTPATPSVMDIDGSGTVDTLIFGDLSGRLWALSLADGHAYGDAPAYVLPGGDAEPIGASVAVFDGLAVFGTGGVPAAAENVPYAVYAVEILPDGGHLRWAFSLSIGEKVWEPPILDAAGNLVFATAIDYHSLEQPDEWQPSGRIIALNRSGEEVFSRETAAATLTRVVSSPGVLVSVALTGEMTRFGTATRLTGPSERTGSVRILSWRER